MGVDATFAALADPTRRAIVERLGQGPAGVSDLAEPFAMSLPAVSKHVTVLERAGLVQRRRVGRRVVCSLRPAPLREALTTLEGYAAFWSGALDRLGDVLAEGDATIEGADHDEHD